MHAGASDRGKSTQDGARRGMGRMRAPTHYAPLASGYVARKAGLLALLFLLPRFRIPVALPPMTFVPGPMLVWSCLVVAGDSH